MKTAIRAAYDDVARMRDRAYDEYQHALVDLRDAAWAPLQDGKCKWDWQRPSEEGKSLTVLAERVAVLADDVNTLNHTLNVLERAEYEGEKE